MGGVLSVDAAYLTVGSGPGAGPGNDRRRARRPQAAGVRTVAGREPAPVARCGRTSRNQAARQVPSMMAASETQPGELNRAVSSRELPEGPPPDGGVSMPTSATPATDPVSVAVT